MIDILLATYNSSKFIEETINSILDQDFSDGRLLIRDGGSTDNTLEIISAFAHKHPGKIILIPSTGPASACENFSALLASSSADYVMLCDHDDVWLPGKISKSLTAIKQAQLQSPPNTPILLFTDKMVVDAHLKIISRSFFKYQNLNSQNTNLNRLLVQNVASGCTMMMTRALVDLCGPIPPQALMHDHWLALLASAAGKIICLNEPTILYRQHDKNVLGAPGYGLGYFYKKLSLGFSAARSHLFQNSSQAAAFLQCYRGKLSADQKILLEAFASLPVSSWLVRRRILIKNKIFKTGLLRNLGMLLIT